MMNEFTRFCEKSNMIDNLKTKPERNRHKNNILTFFSKLTDGTAGFSYEQEADQ